MLFFRYPLKIFRSISSWSSVTNKLPTHIIESLDYHHKIRDRDENKSSKPPPDEKIKMCCIWIFEAYPPSHINKLYSSVEQLGWVDSKKLLLNPDFTKQIERFRRSSIGGGWINLGEIVDEDNKQKSFTHERTAPLPQGVTHMHGVVLQVIPSTTLLGFQFVLDDERASSIEKPLCCDYSTVVERKDTIYEFIKPNHQKHNSVENARKRLLDICSEWIKSYLPGLFADGILDGEFPTVEFITLDKAKPFDESLAKDYKSYMRILGFANNFDA